MNPSKLSPDWLCQEGLRQGQDQEQRHGRDLKAPWHSSRHNRICSCAKSYHIILYCIVKEYIISHHIVSYFIISCYILASILASCVTFPLRLSQWPQTYLGLAQPSLLSGSAHVLWAFRKHYVHVQSFPGQTELQAPFDAFFPHVKRARSGRPLLLHHQRGLLMKPQVSNDLSDVILQILGLSSNFDALQVTRPRRRCERRVVTESTRCPDIVFPYQEYIRIYLYTEMINK